MIHHPTEPDLWLTDVADTDHFPEEHRDDLRAVATWAREYLCEPLQDLGRRGPVCPYAQGSIDRRRFYLTVRLGTPTTVAEIVAAMEPYRSWFAQLAPGRCPESLHTAVLVLFPGVRDHLALIDAAQSRLKDHYVSHDLMIGEFHPGPPDKGGLWNPELRPLAGPVPMLVIRHMVPTDLPFLVGDPGHLAAYRELHGHHVPARLRGVLAEG
ncbi:DUF6875 domain-containing protein [Nonomuraea endophytica]|uniref:DUF6875 domain-containing protein n=1 Tax=Nonomuraea endophytica TaxID=714136 RepID=A0A7W8ELM8_9ACTN|nr:hypothetical protein [Nonomuraea endophytica]MBB5084069.1 hypothetical protein [Nonomuraea endophytica]